MAGPNYSGIQTDTTALNYLHIQEATQIANTVHWRAIVAGLFILMLVYYTLIAMGVGIGAGQAIDVLRGEDSASALGKGVNSILASALFVAKNFYNT